MRGLKLKKEREIKQEVDVASFTDAWIETPIPALSNASPEVASFTDAWIETLAANIVKGMTESHLLQMRGLKLYHSISGQQF